MAKRTTDTEYHEAQVTSVRETGDWWEMTTDDGCLLVPKRHGVEPKMGQTARFYGQRFGTVRGLALDGQVAWYRTPAQERRRHSQECAKAERQRRKDFEAAKAKLDAGFESLPEVFKQRITIFREANPNFRWEYEGYEMGCCVDAVKLAAHWQTVQGAEHYMALATSETFQADRPRWDAEQEEKNSIDKAAGVSDDHSGNSHGMAVRLAYWYLREPQMVVKEHGALVPLVGCEAYGCPHPRPREAAHA